MIIMATDFGSKSTFIITVTRTLIHYSDYRIPIYSSDQLSPKLLGDKHTYTCGSQVKCIT